MSLNQTEFNKSSLFLRSDPRLMRLLRHASLLECEVCVCVCELTEHQGRTLAAIVYVPAGEKL